ncbi:MAG TPA: D-2-hydroxyacid dehydrogenase [Clostridiaceae bacterium]|nr:D-2-hydroxyacid dehydrogenase [Clostridiaceae bacterium]
MKIVVLDGYTLNPGDLTWEGIEKLGDVTVYDRTSANPKDVDLIVNAIGDAEAAYTNKTPITAEMMDRLPNLKFIGVMATGYNVVDTAAAKERGIVVTNVPIYGTAAVAQTAMALLLEICHHVGDHNTSVKAGEWTACPDYSYWNTPLIELAGKTMGIIGLGRIGRNTARIAQACDMKIVAHDGYQDASLVTDTLKYVDLDDLYAQSDVVVLHCPQTPTNTGMINKDSISKMKDGVIIINNSRGPLIVDQDLADALNAGKVYAAGVDVVSVEPIPAENPLLSAKNCIITPHLSWAPLASRARLMGTAVENLEAFMAGNPINVVNK